MSFQRHSNATAREFEATAIKKLVAEGVPKHVAHAFISVGVMKNSQLYERLRDVVCPMEFQEFFIPVGPRDMQDPLREGGTGAMIPRVKKDDTPRFYTQFSMSDVEAVRFIKQYPELRIVNSGKVYNQHAYYANKRFADCELAISMIHKHSLRNGSVLDPRSLVDLGGNLSYHVKRDRDYVHVENPVLDARDKARYVVREVFSGENPELRCQKKFENCDKKFDYAMGIHSTYDLDPKTIAGAMHRRSIKYFVGFMNSVPGLPESPAGVYEADGLVATVDRPAKRAATARYTFKYDPSTEYVHSLSSAASYLLTGKRFDFYDRDGTVSSYLYRIDGFRGCTLVFTIERVDSDVQSNPTVWTPRRVKQYYLTIKLFGVNDLAVDCELFDRLVLQAAAARNFSEYDIVSLYRYAKSLRQRMSLNGITLSSGFCINPQELVVVVVAAYTVAATFRTESTRFFKKATAQMMQKRGGQSFLRSLLSVTAGALSGVLEGLSSVVGRLTFYSKFSAKVKEMVARRYPIEVVVDRPHAGKGVSTMSHMVTVPPVRIAGSSLVRTGRYTRGYTPLPVDSDGPKLVSTAVRCDGVLTKFWSYGIPPLLPGERPRDCSPQYLSVVGPPDYPVFSEEYRMAVYQSAVQLVPGMVGFDQAPLVATNGDRVYRRAPLSSDASVTYVDASGRFQGLSGEYIVFRGVGSKAVMLGRPKVYTKGRCLAFVLFYDQIDDFKTYVSQQATAVASEVDPTSAQVDTPYGNEREDWDVMFSRKGVKTYPTPEAAQEAVRGDVDAGLYVMSGALHPTASTPPLSGASTPVRSRADTAANLYRVVGGAVSEPGVPSQYHPSDVGSVRDLDWGDEVNESVPLVSRDLLPDEPGRGADSSGERSTVDGKKSFLRSALEERIRACDAARRVALESSRAVIDMAIGVASGQASSSRWGALCQGVPGNPVIVSVRGDVWTDWVTGESVEHMAVSDGDDVYDRLENPPTRDGTYVTSEVLRVYTGTGIRKSMVDALDIDYDCQVVSVNGVAGSGKTYQIVHEATAHDVVLCETSAAMKDTLKKLSEKLGNGVKPMGATVDSFLLHRQFTECAGLFIDESYRLHASSIIAAIRLLRPTVVYAYGDSKQIPLLPYIPEFDFLYGEYPFDRLVLKTDTWRCPADVCLALSQPKYYGFVVTTHNLVRRSLSEPIPFRSSVFLDKPPHVVVLTYTKTARDDLKKQGVVNVMTIGQSQGSTFDDVMLFRDSDLKKVLYYDPYQTLVAFTRHRRSFSYVTTAFAGDDSAAYKLIRYVQESVTDVVLASHMIADDSSSDSEIYRTRVSPEDDELFDDDDIIDVY